MRTLLASLASFALLSSSIAARAAEIDANPSTYRDLLKTLKPGDTLVLAPGTYTEGLPITNLNGTASAWITVRGPASGDPAIFLGNACCNTVELVSSSYVAVERITVDGQGIPGVFGVSAKGGTGNVVHHVRVEGCTFVGQGGSQQTVAISTKTPTYGWILRGNVIDGAGTGVYLGNSNFAEPFVGGIIEHNLIKSTIGYGMQIKSQSAWPAHDALPSVTAPRTIIRHNVFVKDDSPSPEGARPNLLVGGAPPSGPGKDALVEIHGNVFVHNANEALLQATGRVSIHDNLFVDASDVAVRVGQHDQFPLLHARIYNNTFYTAKRAVFFGSAATEGALVLGNLIFADAAVEGASSGVGSNLIDDIANAGSYVQQPSVLLGEMDFYPLPGKAETTPIDPASLAADPEHACDFNGSSRKDFSFRGAYAGAGENPGWKPAEAIKPAVVCGGGSGGAGGSGGGASGGGGAGGSGSGTGGASADAIDDAGCACRMGTKETAWTGWVAFGALVAATRAFTSRRRRSTARAACPRGRPTA